MRIGILGCTGRMGRLMVASVLEAPGCILVGCVTRPTNKLVGTDIGVLVGGGARGVIISGDALNLFRNSDVVIDFTSAAATSHFAEMAARTKTAYVVGTTGLDDEALHSLRDAALKTIVVQSSNMSIGVNILLSLVKQVASVLKSDYDVEIIEMHHRNKVDAPSGTALSLGDAVARGRGVDIGNCSVRSRDGITGPREIGDIGFATVRGGDIVGEHTVLFAGEGERLEFTHRVSNRKIFANGALNAALWTRGKLAGLYEMKDVLGMAV